MPSAESPADRPPTTEKLHKVLARAGIDSRRRCEDLIAQGRVEVDGTVVRDIAVRVDAASQRIRVDGEELPSPKAVHYLFYKPRGVLCTSATDESKPRVIDFFRHLAERVFTVGRLDEDSEGLILVTNDGSFADRVAHPRYEVSKTYDVVVADRVTGPQLSKIRAGVWIAEGKTRIEEVAVKKRGYGITVLRIRLIEGRNREIRRILARLGLRIRRLRRVGIGPLEVGTLKPGRARRLVGEEVTTLLAGAAEAAPPPHSKPKRPSSKRPSSKHTQSRGSGPNRPGARRRSTDPRRK